jgi:hypothetical protein
VRWIKLAGIQDAYLLAALHSIAWKTFARMWCLRNIITHQAKREILNMAWMDIISRASHHDLWQNQINLIVWIRWKVNITSMKEIVFRDLRRGFSMSVLPFKYPTDFPFGCQYISGTFNAHYLNIRTIPYLIFYIQEYFRILYKDIRGRFVHIRINALTRLIKYYNCIRFLFKNRSRLDTNT